MIHNNSFDQYYKHDNKKWEQRFISILHERVNIYIVRSDRDVIEVTNTATRRTNKA